MRGREFSARVDGGHVDGWVAGNAAPVLLPHGGPGLSYDYLDEQATAGGGTIEGAIESPRLVWPACFADWDAAPPMPVEKSARQTVARIPGAWLEVVEGAGHFPWLERTGCARAALERLVAS
jgi:hypothetical protein